MSLILNFILSSICSPVLNSCHLASFAAHANYYCSQLVLQLCPSHLLDISVINHNEHINITDVSGFSLHNAACKHIRNYVLLELLENHALVHFTNLDSSEHACVMDRSA